MNRGRRKRSATLARGDSPWDWKGLNLKEKVWNMFWSPWRGHPVVSPVSFLGSGGKPRTVTMTDQYNDPVPCHSPTGAVVTDQGMWKGHDTSV